MAKTPVVGLTPQQEKRPVIPQQLQKPDNWAFSFKYFNQIPYFGVDRVRNNWFVSLLERLKDLCNKEKEALFKDKKLKSDYRYHPIDWEHRNVPIQRSDLTWLKKEYLENDVEYPLFQFQVSKGFGRVVGFWNEDDTLFYIVLLDPLHNIQPAGNKYGYKVDDCFPLSCEYSSVIMDIEWARRARCKDEKCSVTARLKNIPSKSNESNAVFVVLEDSTIEILEKVEKKYTLSEIIEAGLLMLEDK
ncbi:hypothetical protein H8S95_16780 [Pontibacter sp. KCTC 32443]|uniref:hypothetical protein n=1 Tax=Pontibacter TaxID=323449 RepID=UPI00164DA38D|nr:MULTISPECIES: hypothetical protein [Pontibacter]MBC5775735.1 hypothetical protein [Pontibacter sp. KCTC 32443]